MADIEVVDISWEADEEYFTEASTIFASAGKHQLTPQLLRVIACVGGLAVAYDSTDKPVGALTIYCWGATDTLETNALLPPDKQLTTDPPALHLSDIAVVPECRGKGIGEALISRTLEEARLPSGSGFTRYFAICRVPQEEGETSRDLFLRLGFTDVLSYGNEYYDGDLYECPCGNPCRCEAKLMMLERPE